MSEFVFSPKPIRIESGDGTTLTADSGTEYLDMGASYACTPLGHAHPAVVEAISDQAATLTYVQGSYPVDVRDDLYELVTEVTPDPLDHAWLSNSGTEANEAAIKFARHATGRSKVLAMKNAFHGRTLGSLAATWKPKYRDGFEPLAGGFDFVTYEDESELRAAVDEDTAAVIIEPIQGEGGINPADPGFLEAAREATDEAGAALIFDEIQTGVGRTGQMWAAEKAGVTPDILTAAKGIANGLPMGVTAVREWIAEDAGNHGSTFSGGPTIAAAGTATLETVRDEELPAHAGELGDRFQTALREELGDAVREVRGEGLMVGVEVKRGANRVVRDLALEHQILALPAGRTVVRFLPPLVVSAAEIDRTVEAMGDVIDTQ
ncbi:acetylornithine aminotransferase [Halodesulfurarchaeum formicicum]|uniref:Putative [LysW]-aminoadipate semialdehyde/glutamate semialdehyde transaminase n=1 Tax=Halodesulfurarchaeum formicicum TaxID=1873524 RepID=A0A1D8S3C9_9EURY|nr:aspartate aminotransferase family protein [Halodesulfurarchaeum formicicum]AOW79859.1 acetylornithine aminotransferase [Halodesulfurarchaeum formicicum]